jgi:hypothetical protein
MRALRVRRRRGRCTERGFLEPTMSSRSLTVVQPMLRIYSCAAERTTREAEAWFGP